MDRAHHWLRRGLVFGRDTVVLVRLVGSLSDSDLLGRRGATTVWVLLGFPTFVFGCLLGLRLFEI